MDVFQNIIDTINTYMSDYVLLILLVGVGLYFTIRTKFVQVRCFGEGLRNLFAKNKGDKKGISSFGALATAIAAQVGTGNIVGACGAILIGGPGAIFWMWIIAFLGMSTIYAEAVLAQKTRIKGEDGNFHGGPVYYIRTAFKGKFGKFLSGFFAVAIILALGVFGAIVQSNSISTTMNAAFPVIPSWAIGLVIAAIVGVIIIGGAKRVSSVAEKVVPFMAIAYLIGGIVVLCMRIQFIPKTFELIFVGAFNPTAAVGGAFGATIAKAITQGAKRGLFSNEAGMGSTPHAHALADVDSPHKQGTIAMVGVFIDTFVVLTITALVVISTLYTGNGPLVGGPTSGVAKENMAQLAFGSVWTSSVVGNIFVAICLLFFAFTTIIGWNLFGRINVEYLCGNNKKAKKIAGIVYSVVAIIAILGGSWLTGGIVWSLSDFFNQFMVIPNIIALIFLSNMVIKEIKLQKELKKAKLLNGQVSDTIEEGVAEENGVSEISSETAADESGEQIAE